MTEVEKWIRDEGNPRLEAIPGTVFSFPPPIKVDATKSGIHLRIVSETAQGGDLTYVVLEPGATEGYWRLQRASSILL